jgi:hypothetical protein
MTYIWKRLSILCLLKLKWHSNIEPAIIDVIIELDGFEVEERILKVVIRAVTLN